MIFDLPLSVQYVIFVKSIGVGFICGILYGIPEILLKNKNRYILAVKDIIFFIAAGVISFLFALETNSGIVRFYVIAGELIGAAVWFLFPHKAFNAFVSGAAEKFLKKSSANGKKLLHK